MTDRTTCFGCYKLVWIVTKSRNIYFYCKHYERLLGTLKPKTLFLVKPLPPHRLLCKEYKSNVKKFNKKSLFSKIFCWLKNMWIKNRRKNRMYGRRPR